MGQALQSSPHTQSIANVMFGICSVYGANTVPAHAAAKWSPRAGQSTNPHESGKEKARVARVHMSRTDPCVLCGGCDDEGLILLCDGECNRAFHAHCVGFTGPVESDWQCFRRDCKAARPGVERTGCGKKVTSSSGAMVSACSDDSRM